MSAETAEEIIKRMSRVGHGHVVPREDGVKVRCGGPALCIDCAIQAATLRYAQRQGAA